MLDSFLNIHDRFRMKTLMIILSVLTGSAVVHAYDAKLVQQLFKNFSKCNEKSDLSSAVICLDTIKCTIKKDGIILDEKGEFKVPETLQRLEDFILDRRNLIKAQLLFVRCYNKVAQSGVIGDDQAMKIINCGLPTVFFIKPLQ